MYDDGEGVEEAVWGGAKCGEERDSSGCQFYVAESENFEPLADDG